MHGPDKKPSRGVCQICGRPVVAYEYTSRSGCFSYSGINGHTYNKHGKLVDVRCDEHINGLRPNSRELNRPPTEEELAFASKIRGSVVEAPPVQPPRDPNVLTFPVVKQVFPTLLASDIVGVQPMTVAIGPGFHWPWSLDKKPTH
jgi:hypothetical protein